MASWVPPGLSIHTSKNFIFIIMFLIILYVYHVDINIQHAYMLV